MRITRFRNRSGLNIYSVPEVCFRVTLLVSLFLFCSAFALHAQAETQAVAPVVKIEDLDGDGFNDAMVETPLLRVIFSSKTGSPSVLYLKGKSFEENIYPPAIQEMGYKLPPESLKPFIGNLKGMQEPAGFNIELEEQAVDKVVIRATANTSLLAAEKSDGESLTLSKRYTIHANSYHFNVEYLVTNLKDQLVAVGDELSGAMSLTYGPGLFMDPFGPSSLIGLKPGAVEAFSDVTKLNADGAVAGAFNGIGLRDQYFCVLLESDSPIRINASAFEVTSEDPKRSAQSGKVISCLLPSFNLGAKESRTFSFKIYAGPMLLDHLSSINRGHVSEYGFLSTILLRILQFFYGLLPNYGLAIILLTIVVRMVLYPLTLKQTKSMAQMQKIQPMVQDLKDRHKDNPQKFNEEVLRLYQKNNVNPLGGCLPLLLQLPILIALYNTIRIAVELRKTPFLWIADLSKGDPLLILPIAIAALMYYQQGKMSTDPQQQQMMAFMPMFMFVITWSLPAGLLVYWFASSVLGLLQQLQANRISAAL
ncbi:MAG: hypothetical protein CVV42_05240 [Candidatus Riflebacteria bacterium HGW-Riflebacteria-2]|jgi:YidC/Oxa1 family membrane protein insertase|nr:MAG: hypothetical protein CVV42_05240 [Candidatus Riflebacteria bacterium HGW-Riflebacteria-2]